MMHDPWWQTGATRLAAADQGTRDLSAFGGHFAESFGAMELGVSSRPDADRMAGSPGLETDKVCVMEPRVEQFQE